MYKAREDNGEWSHLAHGLVFLGLQRAQSSSRTKAVYYLVLPLLVPGSQSQSIYRVKSPNSTHISLPLLVPALPGDLPTPICNSNTCFSSIEITPSLKPSKHGLPWPLDASLNCKYSHIRHSLLISILSLTKSISFSRPLSMTLISSEPQKTQIETRQVAVDQPSERMIWWTCKQLAVESKKYGHV